MTVAPQTKRRKKGEGDGIGSYACGLWSKRKGTVSVQVKLSISSLESLLISSEKSTISAISVA